MGHVRALHADDIGQVTALYRAIQGDQAPPAELERFFTDVFLRHPWVDDAVPSLVYEDGAGRVVGVMGAMQRPMTIRGRRLRAIVTHDFMVAPESRATMAAFELFRRVPPARDDLVLSDGNDRSRTLWAKFDGSTAFAYSLRWVRVLRPAQFVTVYWSQHTGPRGLAPAARPLARAIDTALAWFSASPFRRPSGSDGAPLDVADLLRGLDEISRSYALRPCYDEPSLAWLLEMLGRSKRQGALRGRKVTGGDGAILGWFLYRANRHGWGEVVQLGARREAVHQVLDCLFADAWRQGCVAVSGQVRPELYRPLSEKLCFFNNSGSWLLYETSDGEVREALQSGDGFVSWLECEGWMRLAR